MGFFEFLYKTIKEVFKFPFFSVLLVLLVLGLSIYIIYWLLKFPLKPVFKKINNYLKERKYKRIIKKFHSKPKTLPAWKLLK